MTLRPRSQTDLSELSSRLLTQTASLPPCDPASVNMTQTNNDILNSKMLLRCDEERVMRAARPDYLGPLMRFVVP